MPSTVASLGICHDLSSGLFIVGTGVIGFDCGVD
jgi:hypothetical protein